MIARCIMIKLKYNQTLFSFQITVNSTYSGFKIDYKMKQIKCRTALLEKSKINVV